MRKVPPSDLAELMEFIVKLENVDDDTNAFNMILSQKPI